MWKHFLKSGQKLAHGPFCPLAKASHVGAIIHSITATVFQEFLNRNVYSKGVTSSSCLYFFLSHVSLYLEELKLKVSCSYPWPDSLSLISKMIPELPSLPLSKTQNSSCPFLAQKHVNESLFPTDIAQILGWLHNILYNILTFSSIGLWQTVFSLSHLPGECLFICPRAAETTTSTHPSLVPWRLCCFLICVFLACYTYVHIALIIIDSN